MSIENNLIKLKEPKEETEEEKIIKSLVDDIYEYEEKILEINSYLNKIQTENSDSNLLVLKKKENTLKDKLNLIKIKLNDELSKKDNIITAKKKLLNSIEQQINIYKNKLNEFNTLSFNSLLMTKYIISNNINEFLTKEQIDNIIKSSIKYKPEEVNNRNNLEEKISKEIEKTKEKMEQIKENILMMKEEKKIINNEIIELISKKETIDSLVKSSLINLNENINYNMINKEDENLKNIPELNTYELNFIDTYKISKNISNELYELYNINKNEMINNNELPNDINIIKSDDNFNKQNLEILIKSELDTFLLNQVKNKEIINNLMNNLCIIITTKLQLLNIEDISSDKLKIYLLYYFKSIYYDNIIENKFKFINKEYKMVKKELKKNLEILNNELTLLQTKQNEINKNKKLREHENENNNEGKINLTKNEQDYIQICSKGNGLLNQKEEILNIINNNENEKEKLKIEKKEEMDKIINELNEIKEQISNMTNNEEKIKIKLNNDILNYRKIISDKFDLIKNQLQKYKNKYGSNLGIYTRLINGINDTIKKIYKENNNDNNINKNNNENNTDISIYKSKLISLTKGTECYFREITNNTKKFNPIEISSQNSNINLQENPYYFSKAIIILNSSYDNISLIMNNMNYYYNILQLNNTIMNTNLKIIIDIHRDYRKYKKNKINKAINMIDFIKREKMKYLNYNNEFIESCANNKYFNFSLCINGGKKIEIVFSNYDDFKLWINGFAFIIKNKKQILQINKNIHKK